VSHMDAICTQYPRTFLLPPHLCGHPRARDEPAMATATAGSGSSSSLLCRRQQPLHSSARLTEGENTTTLRFRGAVRSLVQALLRALFFQPWAFFSAWTAVWTATKATNERFACCGGDFNAREWEGMARGRDEWEGEGEQQRRNGDVLADALR